jgi:hypothetical protein
MDTTVVDPLLKECEIFENKRTDKVYVSPRIQAKQYVSVTEEIVKPLRIVSKIIPSTEGHAFIKQGQQIALRITQGERQEIVAKIYEDTRGMTTLTIQKFTKETGAPHKVYFTFIGEEIYRLVNFVLNTPFLPISGEKSQQFTDDYLKTHIINREQAIRLLSQYPDIINEITKGNVSSSDITEISKRKESLKEFSEMLSNGDTSEGDWQRFFQANTWIFGYGLSFIFNAPLEGKKLEQVVAGQTVSSAGKRVDALLSRKGIIEATCFVEIKKHNTPLLSKEYRRECFSVSDEVIGGITQIQKTIQKSLYDLTEKFSLTDKEYNPIRDIYTYQPKGYLVIGSLSEFETGQGINEVKYSSFELFRRNISNPEIITFDELYERAKFIVSTTANVEIEDIAKPVESEPQPESDDLPF